MSKKESPPEIASFLVIGYGNQSRRDDGVGWFVLEQLAALDLPNVELETAH